MTTTCILCDSRPTTRAHILGRVLRDEFPTDNQSTTAFQTEHSRDHSVIQTTRHGRGLTDFQPKVLCARCNGSWMGPMEEKALPILAAMSRGEEAVLTKEAQADIAAWAVAATILRGEVDPDLKPFGNAAARAFRSGGLGAAEVEVWLAQVERSIERLSVWPVGHTYLYDERLDVEGVTAIFWLRSVCLVVASSAHARYVSQRMPVIGKAAVRLWPAAANPAHWPLEASALPSVILRSVGASEEQADWRTMDHRDVPQGRRTNHIVRVPTSPA